jgi:hypothetical protein
MKLKKDFGVVFWIHLTLILLAYFSPFFFRWQIIFVMVFASFIQQVIFKGCILTHAQFGKDPHMTFYYRYLTLLGINVNKEKLKFLMTWIMPILVLLFVLFWQVILGIDPIIW